MNHNQEKTFIIGARETDISALKAAFWENKPDTTALVRKSLRAVVGEIIDVLDTSGQQIMAREPSSIAGIMFDPDIELVGSGEKWDVFGPSYREVVSRDLSAGQLLFHLLQRHSEGMSRDPGFFSPKIPVLLSSATEKANNRALEYGQKKGLNRLNIMTRQQLSGGVKIGDADLVRLFIEQMNSASAH